MGTPFKQGGKKQQKGLIGTKYETWRIYRGRQKDNQLLYYCLGSWIGWSFRCYPSHEAYENSGVSGTAYTVAQVQQHLNWGAVLQHASAKDAFTLTVNEGEDPLLLLAWVAIVDMCHDSLGSSEGFVGLHSLF